MGVSPHDAIDRLIPASAREMLGFGSERLLGAVTEARGITTTTFSSLSGCRLVVRQDGDALEVVGDNTRELIFRVELRDRRLDGMGKAGTLSPLNHFRVDHEVANGLPHRNFRAAEISVYSYQPDRYMPPGPLRDFITDPDPWMFPWKTFDPEHFFALWLEAFRSGSAPWQPAPPIKHFARYFVNQAHDLLTELGYHRVDSVCGWYNDVTFFLKQGYHFVDPGHAANFRLLRHALAELEQRERTRGKKRLQLADPRTWWVGVQNVRSLLLHLGQRASGRKRRSEFNDRHRAWWVALQNVPSLFLSDPASPYFKDFGHLYLGGLHWTNSPSSSDYCCRLAKLLNPFQWPET
jgi:hypothetical protein